MSILAELERILNTLSGLLLTRRRDVSRIKLSLPDVDRLKVDGSKLASKVSYKYEKNFHLPRLDYRFATSSFDKLRLLKDSLANEWPQSTDLLIFNSLGSLVLSKFAFSPEYHYPSARLIICDSNSYDLLCRFKRILIGKDVIDEFGLKKNLKNILHKSPFDLTAVLRMQDIVDMFNSINEPIIVKTREPLSRNIVANFNYNLLRKVFPYIKLSDLFVIVDNRDNSYNLDYFNMNTATREQTILHFFLRYARSMRLIDLSPLIESIGMPHQIFKNVLIFDTTRHTNTQLKVPIRNQSVLFNKLDLASLTYLAERFIQLSRKLRLKLKSITHPKANLISEQARIFSQFIESSLSATKQNIEGDFNVARVLVLDRFHNLQSALQHSFRYGPFFEQEKPTSGGEFRLDSIDKLSEVLHLDQLTEALTTLLKQTQALKRRQKKISKGGPTSPITRSSPQYLRLMRNRADLCESQATSQSIKRHLESIKTIYRCLSEGYLIMVKIETALESIDARLRNSGKLLQTSEQMSMVEQLKTLNNNLKQAINTSGDSSIFLDLLRTSFILIDVINRFQSLLSGNSSSSAVSKLLVELKEKVLDSLKRPLKTIRSDLESKLTIEILTNFDKLSIECCAATKLQPTIDQTVGQFIEHQLSEESYVTINLEELKARKKDVLILMFLSSMTPHEVAQLKQLEKSLSKCKIYVFCCGLASPEVFLRSLDD